MNLCLFPFQVEVTEIHALRSDQEDTDSRVVLYLHHEYINIHICDV